MVTVHSVRMTVGFLKRAIKSRDRPLSVVTHLKYIIVKVQAEQNSLAHALVIAIAKVEIDPDYKTHRRGLKIRHVVGKLLETTGLDLSNGAEIPDLIRSQERFREYKIVVYHGLNCDNIMFEGKVDTAKRLNTIYDDVERYYHVITNLTGAMARK